MTGHRTNYSSSQLTSDAPEEVSAELTDEETVETTVTFELDSVEDFAVIDWSSSSASKR